MDKGNYLQSNKTQCSKRNTPANATHGNTYTVLLRSHKRLPQTFTQNPMKRKRELRLPWARCPSARPLLESPSGVGHGARAYTCTRRSLASLGAGTLVSPTCDSSATRFTTHLSSTPQNSVTPQRARREPPSPTTPSKTLSGQPPDPHQTSLFKLPILSAHRLATGASFSFHAVSQPGLRSLFTPFRNRGFVPCPPFSNRGFVFLPHPPSSLVQNLLEGGVPSRFSFTPPRSGNEGISFVTEPGKTRVPL